MKAKAPRLWVPGLDRAHAQPVPTRFAKIAQMHRVRAIRVVRREYGDSQSAFSHTKDSNSCSQVMLTVLRIDNMRLEVGGASAWAPKHSQDLRTYSKSRFYRSSAQSRINTHFVLRTAAAVCKIGLLYGQKRKTSEGSPEDGVRCFLSAFFTVDGSQSMSKAQGYAGVIGWGSQELNTVGT